MGILQDLLGFEIRKDGVVVATRKVLDLLGSGFSVTDNPAGGKADVRFAAAGVSDPTTGFEQRLLPQVDTTIQSADATPIDVATLALDDDSFYEFKLSCQTVDDQPSVAAGIWELRRWFGRAKGNPAVLLKSGTDIELDSWTITGPTLVASGNNVVVRWTGKAATNLRSRIQVIYVKRPVEYPV